MSQSRTTASHCFPLQAAEVSFLNSEERTRISNAERTEADAGRRRREVRGITDWHEQTLRALLRHKTDNRARLGLFGLLQQLTAGYGLGWSDIAKLTGVSIPAVRKWRYGGDIAPARLQNLARIAAFLDMLQDEGIQDPAAWLNLPLDDLGDEVPHGFNTKKEIYSSGGSIELLAYAKGHISHDELISRIPTYSSADVTRSRIVRAPDGNLSIVVDR